MFDVQVDCLPVGDDYIGCFLVKGIPPASFNIYFKKLILNIFIKDCARLEIVKQEQTLFFCVDSPYQQTNQL